MTTDINPQPTVCVVIPTFQRDNLTHRAIWSAINQTTKDLEIVVVDDASSPKFQLSPDLEQFHNIKIVRLDKNGGGAVARNYGVEESSGKYIAFLDSDDEWTPNKLEVQLTWRASNRMKTGSSTIA